MKIFFDMHYGFLHEMYDRFQKSFNNYLTKLDDLNESYDQFIRGNNHYKADLENTLNTHSSFLDHLFEIEVTNKDALNNLERNFNEKVVEFNTHFEQFIDHLNKEMVRKIGYLEVMSSMSKIIEEKLIH